MARVRIVTDSTAHLDPEWIAQHRLSVLPMQIRFGDEKHLIHFGERPERLWRQMADSPAKPSEVSIPPRVLQETFQRLSRETEEILVLLSAGALSSGVANARAAARSYTGRCQVAVIDTMTSSWSLGLVVKAAADAASRGIALDGIVRIVRGVLPRIYMIAYVERLDYLEQGKRLGLAQALLGTMLRIKPLLLVEDGDIIPMEKVRTRVQAMDKLVDFVDEFASIEDVVIMRSPLENDFDEQVEELRTQLSEIVPGSQLLAIEYDPVLACHMGPQALGVAVFEGE